MPRGAVAGRRADTSRNWQRASRVA
jgi:hypothetical protein